MTKILGSRILWGSLLILAGVLFLLQNIFSFQFGALFWALVLGLGGLVFVGIFVGDRQHWWALIPGFTLVGIALTILLGLLFPAASEIWAGTLVLGGIGAGFVVIYLLNRTHWWAIIPGGVMITLALVALLENFISGTGIGGIFFLGLAATFGLVALLPTQEGRMQWAWIPAGILGLMGIMLLAAAESLMGFIWPVALILVGLFLIFRTFVAR